jgi:hypothetical protein
MRAMLQRQRRKRWCVGNDFYCIVRGFSSMGHEAVQSYISNAIAASVLSIRQQLPLIFE